MRVRLLPALFLFAWFFPGLLCRAAEPPSLAAAQSDYAAGDYRACLQKVAGALIGAAARPGSSERFDLFMLRGEALLKMNQASLAAEAFDSASQVLRSQVDLTPTARARATALLVRASPALKYTPAGGASLDVVAPESRAKAMTAFSKERLDALRPKVDSALKATAVDSLRGLLPAWTDCYAVELTATATDAPESLALGKSLGAHARELLAAELTRLEERIDTLAELATSPADPAAGNDRRRGLSDKEIQELKSAIDSLEDVNSIALEGRRINVRLKGDPSAWDALLSRATDCEKRARSALSAKP